MAIMNTFIITIYHMTHENNVKEDTCSDEPTELILTLRRMDIAENK